MLLTPSWLEKDMTSFVAQALDPIGAAAGHDPSMADELRMALVTAALSYAETLRQAISPGDWVIAARRLSGLAASFGAADLQQASQSALTCPHGDRDVLHEIEAAIARLHSGSLQMG